MNRIMKGFSDVGKVGWFIIERILAALIGIGIGGGMVIFAMGLVMLILHYPIIFLPPLVLIFLFFMGDGIINTRL